MGSLQVLWLPPPAFAQLQRESSRLKVSEFLDYHGRRQLNFLTGENIGAGRISVFNVFLIVS